MSADPRLAALLERYRQGSNSGVLTLEVLCSDCPELLPEVRRLLEAPDGAATLDQRSDDPGSTLAHESAAKSDERGTIAPVGYEVLGELGRGGMGVVYRARQVALGREVALKMILSGVHAGEDEMRRFRTEAEAIARLQHPGIVAVYEVGEHAGKPFMALEYCAGGSLEGRLRGTPLLATEAAALVRQLAEAMQAAHDAGVVHRDLKPANVLLSFSSGSQPRATLDAPKVTDFGLAKKLDDAAGPTVSGAIMGTPSYMAPEQACGEKVGPLADVYALGAILYECLTGRPPFRAATTLDTLAQVVSEEPVPVRQLNATVPRDLETICLKCLHKEVGRRYASAAKLADDLGRYTRGEPIEARPVGTVERTWKWARRRPAAAMLTMVSVVALLVLLVGGLWFNARLTEERNTAREQKELADEQKELADEQKKLADKRAEAEKKEGTRAESERTRAEDQLRRSEWLVYAGTLARAAEAIDKNDGALAVRLLEECQWDLRGWEHRHLLARVSSKATFSGHTGGVSSVAYSPDGSRILTGSGDRTAKGWDARTGQVVFSLVGHTGEVSSVAYSPDGSRILTGSGDRTAKVWDARTGKVVFSLVGHTNWVSSVAYSPDGSRILTRNNSGKILAWDAIKGRLLADPPSTMPAASAQAKSPDGRYLARIQAGAVVVERITDRPRDEHPDRAALDELTLLAPFFHHTRLAAAENDADDFALAFHLAHLLRHQPWNADLLVKQAHLFTRQGQPHLAAISLTRALLLNPRVSLADPSAPGRVTHAIRAGNWSRAAAALRLTVPQPGTSPLLRSDLFLAEIAAGDAAAARRTASDIVALLPGLDPNVAGTLQYRLQTAPLSAADAVKYEQHARKVVQGQRNAITLHRHGVALYRAGRHDEAAKAFAESVKAAGKVGYVDTWLFQAMTLKQQGKHDEASALFARFTQWYQKQTFAEWQARISFATLFAEARQLVETVPPMPRVPPDA